MSRHPRGPPVPIPTVAEVVRADDDASSSSILHSIRPPTSFFLNEYGEESYTSLYHLGSTPGDFKIFDPSSEDPMRFRLFANISPDSTAILPRIVQCTAGFYLCSPIPSDAHPTLHISISPLFATGEECIRFSCGIMMQRMLRSWDLRTEAFGRLYRPFFKKPSVGSSDDSGGGAAAAAAAAAAPSSVASVVVSGTDNSGGIFPSPPPPDPPSSPVFHDVLRE